ncbi:MAG TPA: hypothetical protein VFO77_13800, partial [Actinoplanes sp.]|nr:hypothetical protein [Actinoplanes sp.]
MLLEGPAIEPLLAQVREEYGSAVRIISADKVRSGGFGGFFAKQRYELSVEVPDETPDQVVESPLTAARRRAAQQGAADDEAPTLEQLLARAESNDRITGHGGGRHADPSADGDDRDTASDEPAGGFSTDTTFAALMAGLDPANAGADRDRDRAPMVRPLRPAPDSSVAAKPMPSLAELMGGREAEDLAPPAAAPARPNGAGPAGGVATAPNPRLTRLQRTAAAYGQLPSSGPPANATAGTLAPADGAASGPDLGADPLDPSYAGPLDRDDSAQFGPDSTDPLGPGGTDPLGLTATHAGAPPAEVSQAEASQAEASQAEASQAE